MEKVDFVLVGAEGVVESGGIINKVNNGFYFLEKSQSWKLKSNKMIVRSRPILLVWGEALV